MPSPFKSLFRPKALEFATWAALSPVQWGQRPHHGSRGALSHACCGDHSKLRPSQWINSTLCRVPDRRGGGPANFLIGERRQWRFWSCRPRLRSIGNIRKNAPSRRFKQRRQSFAIGCLSLLASGPKRRCARNRTPNIRCRNQGCRNVQRMGVNFNAECSCRGNLSPAAKFCIRTGRNRVHDDGL